MCLGSLSCRKVKLLPSLHWGENWVWPHRHKAQIGGVLQWCLGFSHLHIWSWSSTRVTIRLLVTSLEKALLHQLLSLARRPALGRVLVVPNFFHGNRDYMLLWTFNTADFFPLNSSSERCLDTILFLSSTGTPFDLRTLRIEKHLQIKNTTSSILQHMHCKCSQHNQIKKRAANKILYLVVLWAFAPPAVKLIKMFSWFAGAFSICMCFLKLQRVELSRPPYQCL